MGSNTPFAKDYIFMKGTPPMTTRQENLGKALAVVTLIIILLGVGLAVTTQAVDAALQGGTSDIRPVWQDKNTIQNQYENYTDWVAYTDAINEEMVEASDPGQRAELIGEALSVTAELLQHFESQTYPNGSCAQDFFWLHVTDMNYWVRFYSAWYLNTTTTVGEPIDTNHIVSEYGEWAEFAWNTTKDGTITKKCWNRLDT